MPDGWEETIEDMPEDFTAALWQLGRRYNAMLALTHAAVDWRQARSTGSSSEQLMTTLERLSQAVDKYLEDWE